jgi:hypothetical protein
MRVEDLDGDKGRGSAHEEGVVIRENSYSLNFEEERSDNAHARHTNTNIEGSQQAPTTFQRNTF